LREKAMAIRLIFATGERSGLSIHALNM